jgi:hypothetical protein
LSLLRLSRPEQGQDRDDEEGSSKRLHASSLSMPARRRNMAASDRSRHRLPFKT